MDGEIEIVYLVLNLKAIGSNCKKLYNDFLIWTLLGAIQCNYMRMLSVLLIVEKRIYEEGKLNR